MARVKAIFYLPIKDNDGTDLQDQIQVVEDRCFVEFGAWTNVGFFKGAWRMETGDRQVDTSAVYEIVLEEEGLELLEEILREFKAATTQEMIYLEIQRNIDLRLI